jgi:hypothetical protein
MPDNIEYAYMGYAVTLLGLGGLVAWIYYRWAMLRREMRLIDRIEEEEALDEQRVPPADDAAPESAPQGVTASAVPEET